MSEDRARSPLRLAPDQLRRLDKAARLRGQTRQKYMEYAVMAQVAEDESRRTKFSEPEYDKREDDPRRDDDFGLGLGLGLRRREPPPPSPAQEAAQPTAPVVVNVGNTSNAPTSDIDRLALFVLNGDELSRDHRLRTAVEVLRASTSSTEERKVLAAKLEEAIAIRSKLPTSTSNTAERIARVAFDKLTTIWKGE